LTVRQFAHVPVPSSVVTKTLPGPVGADWEIVTLTFTWVVEMTVTDVMETPRAKDGLASPVNPVPVRVSVFDAPRTTEGGLTPVSVGGGAAETLAVDVACQTEPVLAEAVVATV
jgi:hypothetical protein